jgi:hypothetical protein
MAVTQTRLKVKYTDGTEVEILAGPRAQVDLERHYKMSIAEARNVEHVYYLAWTALHLAGKEPRAFEEWLDGLADVDNLGEVDANPTQSSPPPES